MQWWWEMMKMREMRIFIQLLNTISYAERKTIHSLIVKDEEQNNLKHERWSIKSSLTQHDASSIEENAKLNSSCNHAFLWSNACICKHIQWEHDTCKSSLRSDDKCSDNIRSSDHDDLTYISSYQNMQK